MGELSPWHLAIVAVVVVVLFGSQRLPDAARSLGRSLRIFKTEMNALHDNDTATPPPTAPAAISPAASPSAPVDGIEHSPPA